jgi:hypothetical protein
VNIVKRLHAAVVGSVTWDDFDTRALAQAIDGLGGNFQRVDRALDTLAKRLRKPFLIALPIPQADETAAAYLERVTQLTPQIDREGVVTWR